MSAHFSLGYLLNMNVDCHFFADNTWGFFHPGCTALHHFPVYFKVSNCFTESDSLHCNYISKERRVMLHNSFYIFYILFKK